MRLGREVDHDLDLVLAQGVLDDVEIGDVAWTNGTSLLDVARFARLPA